jgi:hypothetical protein
MSFDVCWNRTWLTWYRRSESVPFRLEAILCERTLIEGKPALRIIARLASILEDEVDNPASRDKFWHDAGSKLGKLRRLDQRDIRQIETMLAKRIPRAVPTPASTVRPSANPVTGPHQPLRQVFRAR